MLKSTLVHFNSIGQLWLLLVFSYLSDTCLAAGTTSGTRTLGHHVSVSSPQETHGTSSHMSSSATNILHDRHIHGHHFQNDEGYWREVKAIIGGVLGFWGGVGSLGTLFLVIVMSQRYCCRKDDDKDDHEG